jgi:hypothetical protein
LNKFVSKLKKIIHLSKDGKNKKIPDISGENCCQYSAREIKRVEQ